MIAAGSSESNWVPRCCFAWRLPVRSLGARSFRPSVEWRVRVCVRLSAEGSLCLASVRACVCVDSTRSRVEPTAQLARSASEQPVALLSSPRNSLTPVAFHALRPAGWPSARWARRSRNDSPPLQADGRTSGRPAHRQVSLAGQGVPPRPAAQPARPVLVRLVRPLKRPEPASRVDWPASGLRARDEDGEQRRMGMFFIVDRIGR